MQRGGELRKLELKSRFFRTRWDRALAGQERVGELAHEQAQPEGRHGNIAGRCNTFPSVRENSTLVTGGVRSR